MQNFYSFFKESLNFNLKDNNKTPNTQTHHQSMARMVKMDHRKSGKNNLVAKSSTEKDFKDSLGKYLNMALSWPLISPILKKYQIIHDHDSKEAYRKPLKRTGLWVYYYPELEKWKISER
jgi:hypothetical protein